MLTTKNAPRAQIAWGVMDGGGRVIPFTVASTRAEAIREGEKVAPVSYSLGGEAWRWLRAKGFRAVRVTITPAAPRPEGR